MKNIDSTKRKSGKEYRKEYRALLNKTKALRNRIMARADELIDRYPNVIYSSTDFPVPRILTVGEYKKHWKMEVNAAMNAIDKIEAHIESLQPYKQGEIDWNTPVEVVPEAPVGERVMVNGATGECFSRRTPEEKARINTAYGAPQRIAENSTYGAKPKKDNIIDIRDSDYEKGGEAQICNCVGRDMPVYMEDNKRWCPQCGYEVK